MSIREGAWQSTNDKEFILRALRNGRRVDGRRIGDMRLLRMVFARSEGKASAEVQLGRTRVLAVVTGEVIPPFPDRPNEGFLMFNVELGPMAAASVGERNSPLSVEIARIIEVGVRDSQALDTEALCILGGEKVWQLRCDIHVLDHAGNLTDACTLGTMAALRHFRRPEVTIDGSKVIIHHSDDKEPQPLALHHIPICVTFAIFEDNDTVVGASDDRRARGVSGSAGVGSFTRRQHTAIDPTEVEEEVMKGRITFALTAHKELCALHKNGGVAMSSETILRCAHLAASKVVEIHKTLDRALAGADGKAVKERQSRLRGTAPSAAGSREGPGTKSTPFVVAREPLPVAPESVQVKHLDYDDLHVSQSIREEGLRGGTKRGDRGMDMKDARNTDLFARMAKAASLTAASMGQEKGQRSRSDTSTDVSSRSAASGVSKAVGTDTRGLQEMDRRRRGVNGSGGEPKRYSGTAAGEAVGEQGPDTSCSTNSRAGMTESGTREDMGAGRVGSEGEEREGRNRLSGEAVSEFERLAQKLKAQAPKADRSDDGEGQGSGSRGVVAAGNGRARGPSNPMEVDSDEEEPITLVGEFRAAATATGAAASAGDLAANVSVERAQDDGARELDDDDLASAMKPKVQGKGKVRVRGKGRRMKDKSRQRA